MYYNIIVARPFDQVFTYKSNNQTLKVGQIVIVPFGKAMEVGMVMEASMAKLFASEICGEVAMEAMRVHGGAGYIKDLPVERYYRDAPLMIIGEGTNEIMKLLIARRILERNQI